jgi:hypothetical protein
MRPAAHIVQGTVSAAALYPFFGGKAVLFGLSVILIDLDHVIEYVWDTGDWSLRGFFVYHEVLFRNLQADFLSLNIFHTVEFYLLGAWLGSPGACSTTSSTSSGSSISVIPGARHTRSSTISSGGKAMR